MRPVLASVPDGRLGVAVSGGGDSMALLGLLAQSACRLAAITVDHGLRADSAQEAAQVAALCHRLGIAHETRRWHRAGGGNLQAAARAARRALIAEWARERGLGAVALGHTFDDQAETVVLRLARGSGVDGLSGMAPVSMSHGILWVRPLLDVRRDDLRAWLRGAGIGWVEDPSNDDRRFDRVRARQLMAPLAGLGLTPDRLVRTAQHMRRARAVLDDLAADLTRRAIRHHPAGDATLTIADFAAAAPETRLRCLARAIMDVSGASYRPRFGALSAACAGILAGEIGHGLTLHGCVLRTSARGVEIRREPARVAPRVALGAGIWDGRWRVSWADAPEDVEIGALGAAGLDALDGIPRKGIARETLLTTPALWCNERLVAAPVLADYPGLSIERIAPEGHYAAPSRRR